MINLQGLVDNSEKQDKKPKKTMKKVILGFLIYEIVTFPKYYYPCKAAHRFYDSLKNNIEMHLPKECEFTNAYNEISGININKVERVEEEI